MKKYILVVVSAVLIGSVFAVYIFSVSKENTIVAMNVEEKVYIFQLGVFSSLENANLKVSESKSAIVEKVNEFYYVYGAIYSDIYLVSNLKEYYENNNIEYSIKEIIVSSEFLEELHSYENLLKESGEIEIILRANQIILDKYAIL